MSYRGAGTLSGPLHFPGTASPGLSALGEGRIYYDTTSNTFKVSQNNGAYVNLVGTSTLQSAYDGGAAIVEAGGVPVSIVSSTADSSNILTIAKMPPSSQSGIGVNVSMGPNTTGSGVRVNVLTGGSGDGCVVSLPAAHTGNGFVVSGSSAIGAFFQTNRGVAMALQGTGGYGLLIDGGTVTSNTKILDALETWNNAGATFQGIFLNVTNTASAAGSRLLELQTNSSPVFSVDTAGSITVGGPGSSRFSGQYSSVQFACSLAVDWNNGNVQTFTLGNGDNTFTFSNPVAGGRYLLKLTQPASGSAGTVTWPVSVLWSGGTPPTLTPTNGKVDIVTLYYDGTNFFGGYTLNY